MSPATASRKTVDMYRLSWKTTFFLCTVVVSTWYTRPSGAFTPLFSSHSQLRTGSAISRRIHHTHQPLPREHPLLLSLPVKRSDAAAATRTCTSSFALSVSKSNDNAAPSVELPTAPVLSTSTAPNDSYVVTLDDGSQYSYNEAIQRTLAWVGSAIVFGGGLWLWAGPQTGQEFFAGYLVEQSLSVDNLFVFLLLFEYFKVPLTSQDRVLNWGIYGAIVMRAVMIGVGAAALQQFHAILLVFAGILVYSSARFFLSIGKEEEEDPEQNAIVQFSRSLIPSTEHFDGDRFFTLVDGVRTATPLFICMIAVEVSDVVFAVDSIPAVFGVTENPLVVFSSNIFAIMGLRSMYTILSKAATDLKYLEPAVALVLGFIGGKMIAEYFEYIVPTNVALAVVATLLGTGVGLSVLEKQRELEEEDTIAPVEDTKLEVSP